MAHCSTAITLDRAVVGFLSFTNKLTLSYMAPPLVLLPTNGCCNHQTHRPPSLTAVQNQSRTSHHVSAAAIASLSLLASVYYHMSQILPLILKIKDILIPIGVAEIKL